jgi:hypothetical protein
MSTRAPHGGKELPEHKVDITTVCELIIQKNVESSTSYNLMDLQNGTPSAMFVTEIILFLYMKQ